MLFLKNKGLLFLILAVLLIVVLSFAIKFNQNQQSITGNKVILKEIDSLLPLLEAKNITSSDFAHLSQLVGRDEYAKPEIFELQALSDDKEYSHIGHGLGFLYQYVKTGVEPLCPGHALAHYYVFMKHGQIDLAADSLNDSKSDFGLWIQNLIVKKDTNMTEINEFENGFHDAVIQIDSGNSSASEKQIFYFADTVCA